MTIVPAPVVVTAGNTDPQAPLAVLLHGRGSNETDIMGLAGHLPAHFSYVALRAPIVEGGGYAWFANRGIGRPRPESLAATIDWFGQWLNEVATPGRLVILGGFSGGATFAGGVLLADPKRYAGLATLYATLPFDVGLPTTPHYLAGVPVLAMQGDADRVIPPELQARTWQYLHEESGADLTTHGVPATYLAALQDRRIDTW